MLKNILVIADQDTDQHAAIRKASAVAVTPTTSLFILGFTAPAPGAGARAAIDKKAHLQQIIDTELSDVPATVLDVLVTDDIAGYCSQFCAENQIDLVIKTGHRSESLFYTPLDWQLIRELACPVLIATPDKWSARPNVVVTLDIGSDDETQRKLNVKVARWARDWASGHDADLHAAYCVANEGSRDDASKAAEKQARAELETFLEDNGIACTSAQVGTGRPEDVLVDLAERLKADVVVLGSVGRKGVKGVLLGNTAESILHRLQTDAVVIHPDS
ncbi:MAG: universal stress protein [Pseudohongiellaceae bacterium]